MLPSRSITRRRAVLGLGALATLAGSVPTPSYAQSDFPSRPVTLVVPFPAGGSTDVVARLIAARMAESLNQQIVIENRGGAGGNIGAAAVAKAAPDGYTILMGTVATHALNPALYKKMPYDPVKDFEPISLLVVVPGVLIVNNDFPPKTVRELIDLLKAEPGKYSYASSGNGTPLHLSGELFKSMAGVEMGHVPYKGGGPAMVDLIGGHVPIMFDLLPGAIEHIRAGKVRGLGVTIKERAPSMPELPTVAETLPGYETYSWNALFAPAGTPKLVVDRLSTVAREAVADPEVAAKLKDLSAIVVGSSGEQLAAHVQAELTKWAPVVKMSGAQLD
jgi:tripartite-type tricarboxylate transporter receptor subunit TctC